VICIVNEERLSAKDYNSLECEICKKNKKTFWVFTEHDLKAHIEKIHGEDFEKYKKEYTT